MYFVTGLETVAFEPRGSGPRSECGCKGLCSPPRCSEGTGRPASPQLHRAGGGCEGAERARPGGRAGN